MSELGELIVVLMMFVVLPLSMFPVVGAFHAGLQPERVWALTGRSQRLWVILQASVLLVPPLAIAASAFYWLRIRPKLQPAAAAAP